MRSARAGAQAPPRKGGFVPICSRPLLDAARARSGAGLRAAPRQPEAPAAPRRPVHQAPAPPQQLHTRVRGGYARVGHSAHAGAWLSVQ